MALLDAFTGGGPQPSTYFSPAALDATTARHDKAVPLVPDAAYFQFRLLQMHLGPDSAWGTNFAPLAVALTECDYDKDRLSLPFIVGNNLLGGIAKFTDDQTVEFNNTCLAGPLPYKGGNIAFFLGLYGVKTEDFVTEAMSLVETITPIVGIDISKYLGFTRAVTGGLAKLLGREDMQRHIGCRTEFDTDVEAVTGDRYLVYIKGPVPESERENLVVQEDKLWWRGSGDRLTPFREQPYCLVELILRSERSDYHSFGFNDKFQQAQQLLLESREPEARWTMIELQKSIVASPAFVRPHKAELMMLYQKNFEAMVPPASQVEAGGTRGGRGAGSRGAEDGGKGGLKRIAQTIYDTQLSNDLKQSLNSLADNSDKLDTAAARPADKPLENQDLEVQLTALRELKLATPSPEELIEALTLDALAGH